MHCLAESRRTFISIISIEQQLKIKDALEKKEDFDINDYTVTNSTKSMIISSDKSVGLADHVKAVMSQVSAISQFCICNTTYLHEQLKDPRFTVSEYINKKNEHDPDGLVYLRTINEALRVHFL